LTGQIRWAAPLPHAEPLPGERLPIDGKTVAIRHVPNLPAIDPATRAVAGAVVFLRGIDPAMARPWDHPPVTVELCKGRPMIRQGDSPPAHVGFVRVGDAVTMVSREPVSHALRARGAAFFTLTFPDPDWSRSRIMDRPGVVNLTSAVGYVGMCGHLWVSDQPYFTQTDAAGRWSLPRVPAGKYEVVCWLPDWHVRKYERDPETSPVVRLFFGPPHEWRRPAAVKRGAETSVDFAIGD
jgi:hypothetical protein